MNDESRLVKPDAEQIQKSGEATELLARSKRSKYTRFFVAALGSIPWIGGLIAASSALHAENMQGHKNELMGEWHDEHQRKIGLLNAALQGVVDRLESFQGESAGEVGRRLNDGSYMGLVRRGFAVWDRADSEEKREYIRRCLANAAATRLCSDDVVRLFIYWIDRYDEIHFSIIRVLYQNRGVTRGRIWDEIHGEEVREDSAEADLFKLMIFDLNTGRVLRQIRDKNSYGQFLAQRRKRSTRPKGVLESAFEDTKPYELTELGRQFVHYVMNEVAPQLSSED
jgi:hypothetical protein